MAMREQQRRAFLETGRELFAIDVALQFIGRQHHDDIGGLCRFRDRHDLEALCRSLFCGGRTFAQRDNDVP